MWWIVLFCALILGGPAQAVDDAWGGARGEGAKYDGNLDAFSGMTQYKGDLHVHLDKASNWWQRYSTLVGGDCDGQCYDDSGNPWVETADDCSTDLGAGATTCSNAGHVCVYGEGVCVGGTLNGTDCAWKQTDNVVDGACTSAGGQCWYPSVGSNSCQGHGGEVDIEERLLLDNGGGAALDFIAYTPHVWSTNSSASSRGRGPNGPSAFPWFFSAEGPCHPNNSPNCPFPCNDACTGLKFPSGWTVEDPKDEWEQVQAWAWAGNASDFVILAGVENSYPHVPADEYGHQIVIYPPAESAAEKQDALCTWWETPSCLNDDLFDFVVAAGGFIAMAHPCRDPAGSPVDWVNLPDRPEVIRHMELSIGPVGTERDCIDGVPGQDYHSVLNTGRVIGGVAPSDTHGSSSGAERQTFVWSPELTRQSIFDHLKARHTYTFLGVINFGGNLDNGNPRVKFSINKAIMGDEIGIASDDSMRVFAQLDNIAASEAKGWVFSTLELVYNTAVIKSAACTPGSDPSPSCTINYVRVPPSSGHYYVRVVNDAGEHTLVTSPIWVDVP